MKDSRWCNRAEELHLQVKNFINGEFRDCIGNSVIKKKSPRDGRPIYELKCGNGTEVDEAVAHARRTFEEGIWRTLSVHKRKSILGKLKNLIEANREDLALLDSIDVGKPITNALNSDLPMAESSMTSYIENMDKLLSPCGLDGSDFAYQLRKPVGVVGAIIGWNYPLVMAVLKMGPALAMGNSLVLKPSEFSSLSASRLACLAVEAGVPPGVFNVVNGAGDVVGHKLAHHLDVDLLSFTGSSETGKKMMVAAGESNMKRLVLECGGKSPFIVFDDCPKDLDFIASVIVDTAFRNQGEVCVAGSRLLIHASIRESLLPKIVDATKRLRPQDPLDPESIFGALINENHMNRVLEFIDAAKKDGAKLLLGGKRIRRKVSSEGYYVEPTIFDQVKSGSKIAQEEIFGPVLSVFTFESEGEAISLANDSKYGLAAYAATTNLGRAKRLALNIDSGALQIIGASSLSEGSVELGVEPKRQSGFGSDVGVAGLNSYSTKNTIHILS